MHSAAAATIPMTIPVVLLDSRTTSEGPGRRLMPGSVGSAVGISWDMGEIIKAPLGFVLCTTKGVGNGSKIGQAELEAIRLAGVKGCGGGRGGGGAALVGCLWQ